MFTSVAMRMNIGIDIVVFSSVDLYHKYRLSQVSYLQVSVVTSVGAHILGGHKCRWSQVSVLTFSVVTSVGRFGTNSSTIFHT